MIQHRARCDPGDDRAHVHDRSNASTDMREEGHKATHTGRDRCVRHEQRDAKRRQGHAHSQPHFGGQKFAKGSHALYPPIRVWESALRPAPETRLSHSNATRHVSPARPPSLFLILHVMRHFGFGTALIVMAVTGSTLARRCRFLRLLPCMGHFGLRAALDRYVHCLSSQRLVPAPGSDQLKGDRDCSSFACCDRFSSYEH